LILNILKIFWFKIFFKKRKIFFLVIFLILLGSISEMLTLASFLPVISIILSPEIKNLWIVQVLDSLLSKLDISVFDNLSYYIFGLFILIIILNTLLKIFITYYTQNFVKNSATTIATQCLTGIFSKNYEYLISRSSNEIVSALVVKIDESINFLIHILQIITSFLFSIAIIISLLLIDFKVTLNLLLVFTLIYGILLFFLRKKTSKISSILSYNFDIRLKSVQDSLVYLRQILLSSNKEFFLDSFVNKDQKIRHSNLMMYLYAQFPRIAIEGIGILCFSIIAFILIDFFNYSKSYLITIIAVMVFAFQKLLISFNQIYVSFINISALKVSTWDVLSVINKNDQNNLYIDSKNNNFKFEEIIFNNVAFSYSSSKNSILKDINIKISKGDKVGIIGESGSGKSTFLDLFCHLLKPINGSNNESNKQLLKCSIAYASQNLFITENSIKSNIALGELDNEVNHELIKTACERSLAHNFIEDFDQNYETKIGTDGVRLSGGQGQRLSIARVFYKNSEIFLFDESFNSLDEKNSKIIMNNIKKYYDDKTILFVSHDEKSLAFCNKIFEIKEKKIFQKK
jgi:ATP-binding cassette subfamily B protein